MESLTPDVLGSERFKIEREIDRLKRLHGKSSEAARVKKGLFALERRVRASVEKRRRRVENVPAVSVDENLPVAAKKDEIVRAIRQSRVVIVSGETGSGKTTQIPKLCLAAGRGIDGTIGCTQPRRIAAVTVANRIAEELGEKPGRSVGYKIRFDEKTGRDGYIKIMTDGILLAEAQSDPFLSEYDVLIIDEAHERSLNIDFVLGILKKLIAVRKDLKLVITSATIDTEKFSMAFDGAPVVEVSGRMYPVEVEYWPPEKFQEDEEITHVEMAVAAVERIARRGPFGDILVFMPTEQDIRETCELLEGRKFKGAGIFPLFARLSSGEQRRVFSRWPGRKIIVATNVAETSITIPGIKYVVDTGLARMLRYSPRTRTTALPVEPVSRSSADQRMGRCGRVENGVCLRLYSKEDYESRPLYTPPEILRSNLAEVILRMIALNLGDVDVFPFIDRPEAKSVSDGFDLLGELGAIRELKGNRGKGGRGRHVLTKMGRFMADIPLDPRISRMLIEARFRGATAEVLVIAAALSIQDPRERPLEKAGEADRARERFADPMSDFVSLLNLWNGYREVWKENKSAGRLKRFCKEHFLSFKRMREWRDIHEQLKSTLEDGGVDVGDAPGAPLDEKRNKDVFSPAYARVHRCVLAGFLSNIAQKKEKNIFKAAKNREVMIFPGSGLFNRAGEWIVAAEMVETSRLFARSCANIDGRWLEELGKGLCKSVYLDARWDGKRGEVVATERVSLFGLTVVSGRTVSYGKINPAEAAGIFVQSALVGGELAGNFGFMAHNRRLIEEALELEDRLRRRDVLVGETEMVRFYESRLNESVYDARTLRNLIRKRGGDGFLRMKREDVLNYSPDDRTRSLFPERISLGGREFACRYRFDPGDEKDGVTVKIPIAEVHAARRAPVDWHVPGLLEEKITFLLKGLPKKYRKELVPVAETVKVIVEKMPRDGAPLVTALSRFIHERFRVDIPAAAWPCEELPDHLKMRFAITDSKGVTVRSGRDRDVFSGDFAEKADPDEIAEVKGKWERSDIREWDFGDLPDSMAVDGKKGGRWVLHPGLRVEESGLVGLRLFEDRDKALASHKSGVMALYRIHLAKELKFLRKTIAFSKHEEKHVLTPGGAKWFEEKLFESVLKDMFHVDVRTGRDFLEHGTAAVDGMAEAGMEKKAVSLEVLKAVRETREVVSAIESAHGKDAGVLAFCRHLRAGLANLAPENFLALYGNDRLAHLPRYVRAIAIRAGRGVLNPEKDTAKAKIVKGFVDVLEEMLAGLTPGNSVEKRAAVEKFFWLIEEFKVSLFAQELKTAEPVSEKRLRKLIDEIRRMV